MPQRLDIDAIRGSIPAASRYIYLNTGWQGPSPHSVIQAVQDGFAREASGPTAADVNEYRLGVFRENRRLLAELIGATPGEVTLQQSTTEGINIVLSGLGLERGDEVIICNLEHTSVVVPAYYARERQRAGLKIVRLSGEDTPQQILDKFEQAASPRLKLILVSHITYATGQLVPARELAELAHSRGGYLLLDAAQTAGQIPLDVRELDCDFCAFPGHKWLLGPAGTGALYIREPLIEGIQPPKVAHRASEYYNFKDRFVPRTSAVDKFELTTVSVPLLAGLNEAVNYIQGLGLDAVRERTTALARYATERLAAIAAVELVSPAEPENVQSGLVSFRLPEAPPERLTAFLWERARIVARTVPDARATRIALHVFNTEEEVDRVAELVEEAAVKGVPEGPYPSVQVEWDTMVEL